MVIIFTMIDFNSSLQNMITRGACVLSIALISFTLTGCDNRHAAAQIAMNDSHSIFNVQPDDDNDAGNKLFDLAGQASVPNDTNQVHTRKTSLPNSALPYVGRYHVHVDCSDASIHCTDSEGGADYILNLLADGSVYCQRVSLGRIKYTGNSLISSYQHGRWAFSEKLREIDISFDSDSRLCRKFSQNNDLIVKLSEAISRNQSSHDLSFSYKFYYPDHTYKLVKLNP